MLNFDSEKVLEIAGLSGLLILQNGGETYRAEETTMRICEACGYKNSEIIAIPTGIFITLIQDERPVGTIVKSLNRRVINLDKLDRINYTARAFIANDLTIDEALDILKKLNLPQKMNKIMFAVFAAVSTCFFIILMDGGWFDCLVGCVCGFVVQYIILSLKQSDLYNFIVSLIGGIIISIIAVIATTIFKTGNVDVIIIGGIIPLLPGLAMINAIRDTMTGDLVSGMARIGEVLLIAVSLAGGVGIILSIFIALGGVM